MILYRKVCKFSGCGKKFKGGKLAKYCCGGCRVKGWNERQGKGEGQLKKLLQLELKWVAKGNLNRAVEVCLEVLREWNKGKNS